MLLCETHSSHVRKAAIASNVFTLVIKERLKCRGQHGNGPCQTQARSHWKCDPAFELFTCEGLPEDPSEPQQKGCGGLRFAQESVDREYAVGGVDSHGHLGPQIQLQQVSSTSAQIQASSSNSDHVVQEAGQTVRNVL